MMKAVFFYGLFMDADLLKGKSFHPAGGTVAFAKGYGLRIGEKSTLVPSASETVYGIVMSLAEEEIEKLYSEPGVSQYRPEYIEVTEQNGKTYKALCYILPKSKLSGSNEEYAASLVVAAEKMGLPATYINQIYSRAEGDSY